ncbi:histidine phosphatase family protein [Bifidobacterium gallicum]|uniref:Phosphoglycerate mutase n=1 Tax=Bifidobacterium gallicum DSM 20093 = LMG 11596 TaxID=561180 RepID=D1NTU9_9BIFI|nr:histidine phosphatase family protein [Bifidobacterium gallicum]EFA23153.1 phosphoglycerate mutase family protein [Bifidobacterium gallicum DSM 20093 = LMG 11596]KFI58824.1 phosphoglycerate mutase [Bifidobacterium gallicum DSM 20093 = LMG 11596]
MIDHVIFLRHGRTAFNLARRMQGQIDVPLDVVGHWQVDQSAYALAQRYYWAKVSGLAHRAGTASRDGSAHAYMAPTVPADYVTPNEGRAQELEAMGEQVAAQYREVPASQRTMLVYSSDLLRAQQTAHAFADIMDLPVHVDARLRERDFGMWEGMTREQIAEQYPEGYRSWRLHQGGEAAFGVESRYDLGQRGAKAVCDLCMDANAACTGSGDESHVTLMVVSHGSWIGATIQTLLGLDVNANSTINGMRNAFWSTLTPPDGEQITPGSWLLDSYDEGPAVAAMTDWENGPQSLHTADMPVWKSVSGPKA